MDAKVRKNSMRKGKTQGSRWRSAWDEASLATFPEEFRQGMAARAEILGDTGSEPP